jgi:hypothetical protein
MIAFLIAAAAAILVGISVAVRLGTNRSLRGSIAARWGRIPEKKPGAEDLKSISSKLLSVLGYHEDIVNKAENSALHFLKEGSWEEIGPADSRNRGNGFQDKLS